MVAASSVTPLRSLRSERRLVVGGEIGSGRRGSVYVARVEQRMAPDEVMARNVALKVIHPALARDEDAMRELRESVRRTALVRHANVVDVSDFFVATLASSAPEPLPCIASELVDGISLSAFVARFEESRRRMPLDLALFIGCEIAEGLAAARAAPDVHGAILNMSHEDLSPRQVLLSWNGEVKVGDFGLQPSAAMSSGVRRAHDPKGNRTLVHMAPEVACGERGDGRSDVFSFGVILHEMLYGPRFRRERTAREMLELVRDGAVDHPLAAPLLPEGLRAVVNRALSYDPDTRPLHAGIVAYDLRQVALALGVGDGRMFLRSALFDMMERSGDTRR